ncbi:tripartite motif-containing protein 16-like [Genypterus blacodes]|uniref:tripartite motif-containing protein 16-like n=1 Tax=Genypterus blacodes TaxID=154954 RepID=UPI003F759DC5
MAQQGMQLDQGNMSCSICLDLLKDPVTIPCGHSYCMSCIRGFWDEEDQNQKIHSCPQCRQTFTPTPILVKNTMMAHLVEELNKTEPQAGTSGTSGTACASDPAGTSDSSDPSDPADPADPCHAGPADVSCDFCPGTKRKAVKSCVQCVASYCEQHLQPHYGATPFKKHKLIEASATLQENICSHHNEVMKMFCHTDQQCICYRCPVDEHKGHKTVSAAAERAERQEGLAATHKEIQQKVKDTEEEVKVLQQEVEAINCAADEAVTDIDKSFTEMIALIEKRSCDLKEQIRSKQKTEVSRAEDLQEELKQKISELRRKEAELQQLPHIEDDIQFLHSYPSLSCLSESTDSLTVRNDLTYFENVTAAVSETQEELKSVLREESLKTSAGLRNVDVLLSAAEPKTRSQLNKHSYCISLDPDTIHKKMRLYIMNREVHVGQKKQPYSSHADRFTEHWQALSEQGVTGRFYGEVMYTDIVHVAVAYTKIVRDDARRSEFGSNWFSWALFCNNGINYKFTHNGRSEIISGPKSLRVGVYVDHSAGILCFYSVSSKSVTLLHRVKTTFTEPLHVGLGLPERFSGLSARLWY